MGIAYPVPLYVLAIDVAGNCLIVGERADLKAQGLVAADLNILVPEWPAEIEAKIRYRRKAATCEWTRQEGSIRALFQEAEEAITPGQAVVFYHDDYVLGGGAIEEVLYAA